MRSQKITVSFCPQWRYTVSIIDEISRLVIKRLTMSNGTFALFGSTLPSTTRPGVVSYHFLNEFRSRPHLPSDI